LDNSFLASLACSINAQRRPLNVDWEAAPGDEPIAPGRMLLERMLLERRAV